MNGSGNPKQLVDSSSKKGAEESHKRISSQARTSTRSEMEKSSLEAGSRSFSDLYRNSSEEIFLTSMVDNSIGMMPPSMEMLGFKKISQPLRLDSEELFNSWLMNAEIPGCTSSSIAHCTRQASKRLSTEIATLTTGQHGVASQRMITDQNIVQQNLSRSNEFSNGNQHSLRNASDKGMEDLYLAKTWFQSSQPITRSRSSELRRRYAAMQNSVPPPVMAAHYNGLGHDKDKKQDLSTSFCCASVNEIPNQLPTFVSPSNSYTSPVTTPSMTTVDAISSVVNMLKGTLERKKLRNSSEREMVVDHSLHLYSLQEISADIVSDRAVRHIVEPQIFQAASSPQMNDLEILSTVKDSAEILIGNSAAQTSQNQMGVFFQEPSQSESSAAAPALSTGFEACDGPINSAQTVTVCESSRRYAGNGYSGNGSKSKELDEGITGDNLKNEKKKVHLVRMGSVSSVGSGEKGDPTKKRRVERSRKMAEAKERNSSPAIPSDMQSVLKRCENLEKEVRSLKLNLSFMNRKDSEQTTKIEELQKQNDELMEEKERLLEAIERINSDGEGVYL